MDYEEWKEKQENNGRVPTKVWNKLKPMHVLALAALLFVGINLLKNNQNTKVVYWIVGGLVLLYFLSVSKEKEEQQIIPRFIAQRIAHEDLLKEIGPKGIYPNGTQIIPNNVSKMQSIDSGEGMKPFKWNIGFRIKEPNRPAIEVIYKLHPYTGNGVGVEEVITGYDGGKTKDIQLIFPEKTITEEKKKESS